jgi:hypothetical protein
MSSRTRFVKYNYVLLIGSYFQNGTKAGGVRAYSVQNCIEEFQDYIRADNRVSKLISLLEQRAQCYVRIYIFIIAVQELKPADYLKILTFCS